MIKISPKYLARNGIIMISLTVLICCALIVSFTAEDFKATNETIEEIEPGGNSALHALIINEVMSQNRGAYAGSSGEVNDWVELYNGTSHDIDLTNFGLSDTKDETKWLFPKTTIKAKSYLIINLTGSKMNGLNANFSLKSGGGESVILRDTSGMIVDSVALPALTSNAVLARNTVGEWVILEKATPNFVNTQEGYLAYIDSLTLQGSPIIISEVLPENAGNFSAVLDTLPGYIEITNTGSTAVNLLNYTVGDELGSPFQWRLPERVLGSGESIVVYTSNLNRTEGDLHADFTLNAKNGSVFLGDNSGHIIDRIDYTMVPNGYAIQRNGELTEISAALSPNYPNTLEGITQFQKTLKAPTGLILNEVMTNNTQTLLHNGANAYSWIELKNTSQSPIELSEYTLSKTFNPLNAVALPSMILQPGQFVVLMASGDQQLSTSSYDHIDLKLTGDESLYLFKGTLLKDSLFAAGIKLDDSYGRANEGGFVFMEQPSPNAENNAGYRAVSISAQSTLPSGIYDQAMIDLGLLASGRIYYTTDGETPTTGSSFYSQPINLKKTSVIKAITVEEGKMPSDMVTYTYVLNEGFTLPVVSLTLDDDQFRTLQANPWNTDLEYPGHIEYFDTNGGFSSNCGVQLFGGSTRGLSKKSFAVKFKQEYGEDKLNYKVFDTRDFSVFDTLVLRSGSQDYSTTFFRDILSASVMEDSQTVEVQAYTSVILYINGTYWGLYDFREKVDEDFVATHYNVDESTASVVRVDGVVSAGTKSTYNKLMAFISNHDLSVPANYETVQTWLNIDSYIDFWISNTFTTNNDMINTRFISSTQYDDGRMHMVYYDQDYAWYYPERSYYDFMTDPEGMSRLKVSTLLNRRLFASETYRTRFLERLSLSLRTIWKEEAVLAKFDTLVATLRPEIQRDFVRWRLNPTDWEKNIEDLRNFIEVRTDILLKQTRIFFKLSDADFNKYFGGL